MTTTPVTSVPAAITYIVNAVQQQVAADPAAKQILLTLADPADVIDAADEIISIGAVTRDTVPTVVRGDGGANWLNETYSIAGFVSTWTGSSDSDGAYTIQLDAVQRVWQLYNYVETAIRLDPGLGPGPTPGNSLVDEAYPKVSGMPAVGWTDDPVGTAAQITFSIFVSKLN